MRGVSARGEAFQIGNDIVDLGPGEIEIGHRRMRRIKKGPGVDLVGRAAARDLAQWGGRIPRGRVGLDEMTIGAPGLRQSLAACRVSGRPGDARESGRRDQRKKRSNTLIRGTPLTS